MTRRAQCSKCGSTGQSKCTECGGSGQVRSAWYRSLATLTGKELKYEYDKRDWEKSSNAEAISEWRRYQNELLHSYGNNDYDQVRSELHGYYAKEKTLREEMDAIVGAPQWGRV